MATLSPVEESLALVEACLARVGSALKNSEADALQRASEQLRLAAMHFSQALQGSAASLSPAMVVRVRTVSVRLTSQRDALARMSAVLDRQVRTLVPEQAPSTTYGASPSGRSAGAARIYRSAG
ncbi:MAG: hypothetical protein H3C29_06485 [Simplicispira suum]|uniref:hypothetical protein n=1 Tax=Simplicispira suum TaxID=2109915 RepID=UPI001C6B9509|nr:hypothetical protein [Simplicispira suum]MBW7832845.1 hypothetical protein [Simplicispira suum]